MHKIKESFFQEINKNITAEVSPTSAIDLNTNKSFLSIRERGGFIVSCELTSLSTSERYKVLYSSDDIHTPKLTASHIMSPVGPSEGIGGQHGFPRWADYRVFSLGEGDDGEKRVAIQAKRSDDGLAIAKTFELSDSALSTHTTLFNSESNLVKTSIGEHLYFSLLSENFEGLKLDGKSLDELLGDDAENSIKTGNSMFWDGFLGQISITFPSGYKVNLLANSINNTDSVGLLIWHKPGSPSICIEPTIGFNKFSGNRGLVINPYDSVTLHTKIELE